MRVLPPVEEKIRSTIRDAQAIKPLITVSELHEHLENTFGRGFSRKYVKKLSEKVHRQALIQADRTQLEERMNFTRENYRMMRERLLEIVYWKYDPERPWNKGPYAEDVIDAAKTLVMLDLAIFKAELETGMFKKPVDELAKEITYEPLPIEVRAVVINTWNNFGLLPAATVEKMVPLQAHAIPAGN